jgi:DegV family protein with EDD domain
MTNILTDSTADLGDELASRFGIDTIPLYVYLDEHTFIDGVDITLPDLFSSVKRTHQLPKTSAPTVSDFQKAFSRPGETVYIGISSRLSATHQNAIIARESLNSDSIHLVDTLNLSTGIGLLAIQAAKMRSAGIEAAEIARCVAEMAPLVRTSFIVDNLDYLHKGGRCSAVENIMGSLLNIRPVIGVRSDGTLGLKGKTRGSRKKALRFLLDDFDENLAQMNLERVFVTHTGCDDDAAFLRDELLKMAPITEVLITYAGSVIASHCGPDTIGLLYLLNRD